MPQSEEKSWAEFHHVWGHNFEIFGNISTPVSRNIHENAEKEYFLKGGARQELYYTSNFAHFFVFAAVEKFSQFIM